MEAKFEFEQKGFSRFGMCFETYPEYLIRIVGGKPRTYGVSGTREEEIQCATITRERLNIPELALPQVSK